MAPVSITLRVRFSWLVFPYLHLTRFGVWMGLPINIDVAVKDVMRGVRVEVVA